MIRRVSMVVLFNGMVLVAAQAQWQPCQPGSSVCQTAGNVGIGTPNPSQALEVVGQVLSKSFGVGGVAPSVFQFFATSPAPGVSTGFQLQNNYASRGTTFLGGFGEFGTYLSHNRDPQNGAFVDAAAAPNQRNAVQLVLGDTHRGDSCR